MLPRAHRLTRPADFSQTVRRGRRAGTPPVVVHLRTTTSFRPARVGFIVSKAVGPAVVRNRTKRRLRHLMAARVDRLPAGTDVVVRALPAAADRTSDGLAAEIDRAMARVSRPVP